ncbi:hypothetical protein ACS0TY_009089 [Phlomoides rotata]
MHESLHHHASPILLLLLLFIPSIKSEIQTFKLSSDHRPFILLQDFGFNNPGYISISISSLSISAAAAAVSPTQLSFMGCFYGPTPARQAMELAVLKDTCIIGSPFIFPITTFNEFTTTFNKTVFISIPDLYYIFLINCAKNSSISMTLNLETYNLDSNGDRDYIDDHFTTLPTTLFAFTFTFLALLLAWLHGCTKNKRFVHKIHALMGLLLFLRFVELLCDAYVHRSIRLTGSPHGWNMVWLSVYLARTMLFVVVIMLIRSGWSLFRQGLQKIEKYAITTTVLLQVIAGVCFVLIQVFGPSNRSYKYWTVTYYAFDFLCCAFMLLPVCKSIDNLGISSKAGGKEAKRLVHQRVYENLAIVIYVYLGFTRLGMFVLRAITSYNFWCLSIALEMTMEFIFYVVVYAMFWPNARYDYVVLDDGDEDHTSIALSGSMIGV